MDAELAVTPGDGEFLRRRALYSAKAGDCDSAVPQATKLMATLPRAAHSAHQFAYVFALCGERDKTLAAMREAIELGISPKLMSQEDEFASLRDDPEFQALTRGGGVSPD